MNQQYDHENEAHFCKEFAAKLKRRGEVRASAFYLDCARQHRIAARYFRRYLNSTRNIEVG